ncbi:hypothetical protein AB0O91_05730 [Kitasatospora sp. NPDC089797]|uniref:hypothetical protein n=1 Tax=Kitasatospora sp. NPDC089797 TaxID=3155298 RepID=UPI00342A6F99
MSGRISASRASAVRAAQQAKAERDAERLRRERQVESALADFYEQTGKAEQLRTSASARAAKIVAHAERAAVEPERRAREAVALLHDLGEPRDQIAVLTGLALTEVRAILAGAADAAAPRDGGRGTGAAPAVVAVEAGPAGAAPGSGAIVVGAAVPG